MQYLSNSRRELSNSRSHNYMPYFVQKTCICSEGGEERSQGSARSGLEGQHLQVFSDRYSLLSFLT